MPAFRPFPPFRPAALLGTLLGFAACNCATADTFISEIHYDNSGSDVNEAIEISTDLSTDLSTWSLVLYNGSNGNSYTTTSLPALANADSSCGDNGGTIVINYPTNGIQNGSPDGLALVNDGEVVQFLSYEGSFTASNGPAAGLESSDIGQSESASTAADESLQLINGQWAPAASSSFGICTSPVDGTAAPDNLFISEFHYDNEGADLNEGIELTGPIDASVDGWQIALYNGNDGRVYQSINLSGQLTSAEGCSNATFVESIAGLQNGSPDGIALVDPTGKVTEFISYEGSFTAASGPAEGLLSTDIGVAETSSTAVGQSLQLIEGTWREAADNTFGVCDGASPAPQLVKIHEIQGIGASSAINGPVTVEAIVTADYQSQTQLRGFFIQEEDADRDANSESSEGIFVFCGDCELNVSVGDLVRVTGNAADFFDMTQISAGGENSIEILASNQELPSVTTIALPLATGATDLASANAAINAYYEAFEGMLLRFETPLSVSEHFSLARYGDLTLTAGGRPRQFTDAFFPSETGYQDHLIALAEREVILDDDNNRQNVANEGEVPVFYPQPGLSVDNLFRAGDSIANLSGVLHWSWAGSSGTEAWRLRPIPEVFTYQFTSANPRSESPANVGGALKVASFNVLNYFTTINTGVNACGPDGNSECRGANSAAELATQTHKIVNAVCALDADIVGLMELENPRLGDIDAAINALVSAINQQCPQYAAIETGTVGSDAITVGLIYRPQTVTPIGTTAILDDPAFTDPAGSGQDKNRPAIAQSFLDLSSERTLTVAVNHLKSKGSSCGEGDDDPARGQASCNLTRTLAAEYQAQWLNNNPTEVWNDDYTLVIGDLNAYRNEDPIVAFANAGFYDAVDLLNGEEAYGYLFDGQLGYLDHALANAGLLPLISGITHWHINADELNLFDYNDGILDPGEQSFEIKPPLLPLVTDSAYRSSDHDPVLIGIEFPSIALCHGREPTIYVEDGRVVGGKFNGRRYRGVLFGSRGDDVILGTDRSDFIFGDDGDDLICAAGGRDIILAGDDKDIVSGGVGADKIVGGAGNDVLYGDEGKDLISGGRGQDQCQGERLYHCEK